MVEKLFLDPQNLSNPLTRSADFAISFAVQGSKGPKQTVYGDPQNFGPNLPLGSMGYRGAVPGSIASGLHFGGADATRHSHAGHIHE